MERDLSYGASRLTVETDDNLQDVVLSEVRGDQLTVDHSGLGSVTIAGTVSGARLVLAAVEPTVGDIGLAEVGVVPYWVPADHEASVLRLNAYLKQTAARLRHRGLSVETRLAEGSPAEEILRISAAWQAAIAA